MQEPKKKSSKKIGLDFEKKVERCINSGSFFFDKGDLKTDDYLIECKYTQKGSFRITKKILKKIWNEALDSNKLPKLIVGIEDENFSWILDINIKTERK